MMKKIITIGLLFLFGFFIINFFFLTHKAKTYHAGYMYWSHPTLLEDKWDLVVTETVINIDKKEPLKGQQRSWVLN